MENIIKTEKVIRESQYHKTVQYTLKSKHGEMTYCINYRKAFHISFPEGFKWVEC